MAVGNFQPTPAVLSDPSPWTPLDPVVDPDRESNLLLRVQSITGRLEQSPFYRRFLCQLELPELQGGIARAISPASEIRLVVYGIGSIESFQSSRLQLALALLLQRELGPPAAAAPIEVFDPILSATECAVMAALGCRVLSFDEKGRRQVNVPTLFFMPHCDLPLYNALMAANWQPSRLNRMVVLGNSFADYTGCPEDPIEFSMLGYMKLKAQHLLGVVRYVREVKIEEESDRWVRWRGKEKDNDDHELYMGSAFSSTSWHFFELQDGCELAEILPASRYPWRDQIRILRELRRERRERERIPEEGEIEFEVSFGMRFCDEEPC